MSSEKTYTGSEQAKILGLSNPLYNEYKLDDVVKLKGKRGTYKIGWISSGVIIYVHKKNILTGVFSDSLDGPYWMSDIVGCENY